MSNLNRPVLTLKKKPKVQTTQPVAKSPKDTAKTAHNQPILTSGWKNELPEATRPAATKHGAEAPKAKSSPYKSSDAEAQAQRKERLVAVIKQLEERWPSTFSRRKADIRPWSLDIHLEIHQADPSLPKRTIQHALKLWQHRHRKAYLKKLVRGGPRYDLQGNTKGEVTEREREEAKRQLVDTGLTRSRRHAAGALNPSPQEVVPH
jgi:hypothetical protein